jgi:ADP-heptose:LPS heptosyltransferase
LTSERPYTRDIPSELIAPFVKEHGPFFSLEHSGQFESFATTAGAIMALDLIITVDTSIAHLAGALGKPVWLLLSWDPDWRWGLTGETSIWYPTMRIFRQPKFRDWKSVIANVSAALEERHA